MKRCVIGIIAHVDSGKTTLSEAMLYRCGETRKIGRVDNGDAFLDTFSLERERGITIFSKQAVLHHGDTEFVLLDTPGHVDFSPETERALSVLDYAVLVISGTDGVQSHTETLCRLLDRYDIPTFIFVNKTDISQRSREELLEELRNRISSRCVSFEKDVPRDEFYENISLCDEHIMEQYLESGAADDDNIRSAVRARRIFPVCFGSALKLIGVDEFLDVLSRYTAQPAYGEKFAAKVYKIARENGTRLTYMKITGGTLKVRMSINYCGIEEKISRIRVYSGVKFTSPDEVSAGMVCAVEGLTKTYAGQGLGAEHDSGSAVLEPVLTYCAELPMDVDPHTALDIFRKLEEEDPQLHVVWNEASGEIHVSVMGEIQLEILSRILADRFSLNVRFTKGSIAYKETIKNKVEGVGHYEPLRHYAEVHLIMEPLPAGSGLVFDTCCREDRLDKNWQRLILTHLAEKNHVGVLTGSPITDMKITLASGRAHIKHTEGGDFRQATYRAVRQGLRSAESVLLEPWYSFRIELPSECAGRAMSDIQQMYGEIEPPEIIGDTAVIRGSAPVSEMRDYQRELAGYTHGKGRIICQPKGYYPCHNADEVIAAVGYDCDGDIENSADSVFCGHGAGFVVKWNEVPSYMHLESALLPQNEPSEEEVYEQARAYSERLYDDDELMEIFERTYGKIKRDKRTKMHRDPVTEGGSKKPKPVTGPEYLLVDGYNIIFSWDELKNIAKDNLDAARSRLINRMCNFQGFKRCNLILVFDAYKVKGNFREVERVHNITVVYTKEAETADMYIEKATHELGKDHRVRVATSDNLEQIIILGNGAFRVSATEFEKEVVAAEQAIEEFIVKKSLLPSGNHGKIEEKSKDSV